MSLKSHQLFLSTGTGRNHEHNRHRSGLFIFHARTYKPHPATVSLPKSKTHRNNTHYSTKHRLTKRRSRGSPFFFPFVVFQPRAGAGWVRPGHCMGSGVSRLVTASGSLSPSVSTVSSRKQQHPLLQRIRDDVCMYVEGFQKDTVASRSKGCPTGGMASGRGNGPSIGG
jgi:hypothetical protein